MVKPPIHPMKYHHFSCFFPGHQVLTWKHLAHPPRSPPPCAWDGEWRTPPMTGVKKTNDDERILMMKTWLLNVININIHGYYHGY
jgi:hypothetical protein